MAAPPPGLAIPRVMAMADAWPETVLLVVASQGRCLGGARIDGDMVDVVLCEEAVGIRSALQRSIAALGEPAALPMPERWLFASGERIFSARASADSLMAVSEGVVWQCGQALHSGARFGESASLPGGQRFADAVAGIDGAEVTAISSGALQCMMAEEPMLRIQLNLALSERMAGLLSGRRWTKMSA